MSVYKDGKTNTWRVIYRYTDWKGEKKQTQKRGFQTKREAQAWEREQLNKIAGDLDMNFASFIETYSADMKSRIKENIDIFDFSLTKEELESLAALDKNEPMIGRPEDPDFTEFAMTWIK